MKDSHHLDVKKPPSRSKGLITDILYFLLHKPEHDTRIKYNSVEERYDYILFRK